MSVNTETLPEYQITQDDDGWHAVSDGMVVTVPYRRGKLWMRNGIKMFAPDNQKRTRWLVAELDGVRVYINGGNIIVTKQDLYP